MRLYLSIAALLLAVAAGVGIGYWLFHDEPSSTTDGPTIELRERRLEPADTASASTPDRQIRYVPDEPAPMVRDCPEVPVSLVDTVYIRDTVEVHRSYDLVAPSPLEVSEETAVLTYFDVPSGQWRQDVYSIPVDRWDYGLSAGLSYVRPIGPLVDLSGFVRYRHFILRGGLASDVERLYPFVRIGYRF